ncbi:MAG: Dam family site-specific DNA-(adenine-N6)-methyltransferase [Proteobacteria bacterium]|nr:Dam family site-specific DNA-(adenine-N6)-methyltransferase [Pseudomonadota bacterium]
MTRTKPFLKWAGNKFRCIEMILSSFQPATRLIEPFTGSASIFLNSNFPQYLLAENNLDLVNLFQILQNEGSDFIQFCASYFKPENNSALRYYELREQFNACNDIRLRAALFLYLNRHGYNGLCRYNQKGGYNVPFGRYIKPYFPLQEMQSFYQKAQRANFIKADFRQTFKLAKPGDLIYCDPPYVPLSESANFVSYTNKKFDENDQIELAILAQKACKKNITVIISNHDTALTRRYYEDADIFSFPVKRFISCAANRRIPAQELLAVFKPS